MTIRIGAIAFFILFLLAMPFFVHGQTVTADEIRAQIVDLFERIQVLQAQLDQYNQTQGITQPTTGTPPPTTGTGIFRGGLVLPGQLEPGDRGDAVTRLQQFLASDSSVYPDRLVTGFYGSLTTSAVQRFQIRCGIVSSGTPATTGYGRVGPSTLRALANGCSGQTTGGGSGSSGQVGGVIRISPVRGSAPLTVVATVTANTIRSCDAATYVVNWGDGTSPAVIQVPRNRCSELTLDLRHTYAAPGGYVASLGVGPHLTTVTVTVSANTNIGDFTSFDISSNLSPNQSLRRGDTISLAWSSVSAPPNSAVRLELYNANGTPVGEAGIATGLPTSGSFNWTIPANTSEPCIADGGILCHSDIQTGNTYFVRGTLYTPTNACFGFCTQGSGPNLIQADLTSTFVVGTGSSSGGGGGTSGVDGLTADVPSGEAPVSVSFNATINADQSCDGGSYTIDFNDGEMVELQYAADVCTEQRYIVTHRYEGGGIFNPKLYKGTPAQVTTGNATLVSSDLTLDIAGDSIPSAPFSVEAGADSNPKRVTVVFERGSSCSNYTLDWGDGSTPVSYTNNGISCAQVVVTQQNSHTYADAGNYTILLTRGSATDRASVSISDS